MADISVGEVGSVFLDLGKVLSGGCTGSFTVWVGDMGDDATYWEDFDHIPPQGCLQTDGT